LPYQQSPAALERAQRGIGDNPDRTPDESDMGKGDLAGQLIFGDAFPAEITCAG